MLALLCRLLSKFLPAFMIPAPDGRDYLERLALHGDLPRRPVQHRWNLYLHRILLDDQDRHLHNHPWEWCYSLVLAGGYTEQRLREWRLTGALTDRRRMRPFSINRLGREDYHRIIGLHGKEVWTLVLAGRKGNEWGFLVPFIGYVNEALYRRKVTIERKAEAA